MDAKFQLKIALIFETRQGIFHTFVDFWKESVVETKLKSERKFYSGCTYYKSTFPAISDQFITLQASVFQNLTTKTSNALPRFPEPPAVLCVCGKLMGHVCTYAGNHGNRHSGHTLNQPSPQLYLHS